MAKKKAVVNRSAAIRKYQAKNPSATAKEVVSALAMQGIAVREQLVYTVKSKNKDQKKAAKKAVVVKKKAVVVKRKRATRKKATRKKVTRPSVSALSAKELFEAKKLVDKLGSIDGARKAIETLEQLR